jgi:hypothetical protein
MANHAKRVAAGETQEGDRDVYEKSLEISQFPVPSCWRRQNWPLLGPPNSLGTGRLKKTVSTEALGVESMGARV